MIPELDYRDTVCSPQALSVGTYDDCRLDLPDQCYHLVNRRKVSTYGTKRIVKLDQIQIKDHSDIIQQNSEGISISLLNIGNQIGIADKSLHFLMTRQQPFLLSGNAGYLFLSQLFGCVQHSVNIAEAGDVRFYFLVFLKVSYDIVAQNDKQGYNAYGKRQKHNYNTD